MLLKGRVERHARPRFLDLLLAQCDRCNGPVQLEVVPEVKQGFTRGVLGAEHLELVESAVDRPPVFLKVLKRVEVEPERYILGLLVLYRIPLSLFEHGLGSDVLGRDSIFDEGFEFVERLGHIVGVYRYPYRYLSLKHHVELICQGPILDQIVIRLHLLVVHVLHNVLHLKVLQFQLLEEPRELEHICQVLQVSGSPHLVGLLEAADNFFLKAKTENRKFPHQITIQRKSLPLLSYQA